MTRRQIDGAMDWPTGRVSRDAFVLSRRAEKLVRDPWGLQGLRVEDEPAAVGTTRTVIMFLTGRECPWRCAMCDLWQYTTSEPTPPGAIPAQVREGCRRLDRAG